MEKVIENGMVAVLVSPGYGAGWYSWHGIPELLFDPIVIRMVREQQFDNIIDYCRKKYDSDCHYGGASSLQVVMVPVGSKFQIDEYDGFETLVFEKDQKWLEA